MNPLNPLNNIFFACQECQEEGQICGYCYCDELNENRRARKQNLIEASIALYEATLAFSVAFIIGHGLKFIFAL